MLGSWLTLPVSLPDIMPARKAAAFRRLRAHPIRRALLRRHDAQVRPAPLLAPLRDKPTARLLSYSSFKDRLSIDIDQCVLSGPKPGSWIATPRHVPLMPFLTTSAVYSALTFVGLLHPTTDHEVRHVSRRPPTFADDTTLPVTLHPSKPFPLKEVEHRHPLAETTGSPYALPLSLFAPTALESTEMDANAEGRQPQGGDLSKSPLPPRRVATTFGPMLPWASSRLRALALNWPSTMDPKTPCRDTRTGFHPACAATCSAEANQAHCQLIESCSVCTAQPTPEGPDLASHQGTRTVHLVSEMPPRSLFAETNSSPSAQPPSNHCSCEQRP
jgi:hypothetical protein